MPPRHNDDTVSHPIGNGFRQLRQIAAAGLRRGEQGRGRIVGALIQHHAAKPYSGQQRRQRLTDVPPAENIAPAALLQLHGKAALGSGRFRHRQKRPPPAVFVILYPQGAVPVLARSNPRRLGQRQVTRLPPQQQNLLLAAVFPAHMAQLLRRKTLVPVLPHGRPAAQHFHPRPHNVMLRLPAAYCPGRLPGGQHQQRPRGTRRRPAAPRHKGSHCRLPRTQRPAQQLQSLSHGILSSHAPHQGGSLRPQGRRPASGGPPRGLRPRPPPPLAGRRAPCGRPGPLQALRESRPCGCSSYSSVTGTTCPKLTAFMPVTLRMTPSWHTTMIFSACPS